MTHLTNGELRAIGEGFDRPGSNKPFVIPVSDTQAYKQFGNAVAAPVAVAIAETMAPWLSNGSTT